MDNPLGLTSILRELVWERIWKFGRAEHRHCTWVERPAEAVRLPVAHMAKPALHVFPATFDYF
jgi:hypothetical protein